MSPLSLIFGAMVGLSLGLTGGGGALFTVPLLVYGLNTPAREAVAISLASVGATSFVGFMHRWTLGEVEVRTGLLFAVAGMLGAPFGTWLATLLPDAVLLLAFAGLMVLVAVRLWQQASKPAPPANACSASDAANGSACQRDAAGQLILTSRCAILLFVVGILTGCLSGMFGVGGGFVIVPALVLFSGMSMHRAVGTSLMIVSLVSVSGVAAQIWSGRSIPLILTGGFVLGGILGLFIGQQIGRRIPGPALQKVFVLVILAVALFVVIRNLNA